MESLYFPKDPVKYTSVMTKSVLGEITLAIDMTKWDIIRRGGVGCGGGRR